MRLERSIGVTGRADEDFERGVFIGRMNRSDWSSKGGIVVGLDCKKGPSIGSVYHAPVRIIKPTFQLDVFPGERTLIRENTRYIDARAIFPIDPVHSRFK